MLVLLQQLLVGASFASRRHAAGFDKACKNETGRYPLRDVRQRQPAAPLRRDAEIQGGNRPPPCPYKGISLAVPAVIAGEVELTFSGIASSMGPLKGGRLKPIAIGGAQRSPLLPQVPTFAELGFPEVETHAWFGLLPAGRFSRRCRREDLPLTQSESSKNPISARSSSSTRVTRSSAAARRVCRVHQKRPGEPRQSSEDLRRESRVSAPDRPRRPGAAPRRLGGGRRPAGPLPARHPAATAATGRAGRGSSRSAGGRRRGTRAATATPTTTPGRCSSTTSAATCCASSSTSA